MHGRGWRGLPDTGKTNTQNGGSLTVVMPTCDLCLSDISLVGLPEEECSEPPTSGADVLPESAFGTFCGHSEWLVSELCRVGPTFPGDQVLLNQRESGPVAPTQILVHVDVLVHPDHRSPSDKIAGEAPTTVTTKKQHRRFMAPLRRARGRT